MIQPEAGPRWRVGTPPFGEPPPTPPDTGQDEDLLEAEVHQFEHEVRRVAAGGWRRALTATALGAAAGLAALLGLPRDDAGPGR